MQKIAGAMGVERLPKGQASAVAASLDSEVEELPSRPLGGLMIPCLWPDATYLKCGREGRVASTAVLGTRAFGAIAGKVVSTTATVFSAAPSNT